MSNKFNTKKSSLICHNGKEAIFIAIYHCSIKIISRGKGKSAVGAAAYRSGEKLTNNYDGITHDYTRKSGIAYTEIMLPDHAPPEFMNRSVLWNAVEQIEKSKNSQLAREIEIAIPKELPTEQQISLVREYVKDNFVAVGMCADFAIHDKADGNPHAHILLTMRPLEQDGQWGAKSKKEYITDKNGERIKLKNGNFKSKKVDTIDWNNKEKAELWRSAWADISNKYLAENKVEERIDHRSFERQGTEQIPTIHLGVAASQMEKRGIVTERGQINREIKAQNKILAEIKEKLSAFAKQIKELVTSLIPSTSTAIDEPNPIDLLMKVQQKRKAQIFGRLAPVNDLSSAIEYLQERNIITLSALDEQIRQVKNKFNGVREELKTVEGDIARLSETIKQAETYKEHRELYKQYMALPKGKDDNFRNSHITEILLYEAAVRYIKDNVPEHKLYLAEWKKKLQELSAKKDKLYTDYYSCKDEKAMIDKIEKTVESNIRQHSKKRNRDY